MEETLSFSESDYQSAAEKLGVPVPAIKAVFEVESGGATRSADGRPIIRLEAHWFGKLTGYRYNDNHPQISSTAWNPALAARNQAEAWMQFTEAASIDRNAAIQATSWGAPQIMGFHWKTLGYPNPQGMVDAMDTDAGQLDAFVRFIKANPALEDAMRRQDWAAFAAGYNGTGQIEVYAGRIAAAYARHVGDEPHRTLLRLGDRGDDVKALQTALEKEGFPVGGVDGDYGSKTAAAVKSFQEACGLAVDGVAGNQTFRSLGI